MNDKDLGYKFDIVKAHYDHNPRLWGKEQVADAVEMHWITEEGYKEITGEEYRPRNK